MPRLPVWVAIAALLAPVIGSSGPADAAPTRVGSGVVGAQTAGDTLFPHQGNGGYDVEHYQLRIRWSTSRAISATATITATTTQQPLTTYSFDLEGLTVTAVSVDGDPARFSRVASGDRHKLVVTPARPVSGRFTTTVTYSGTPAAHTDPDGSQEGWVDTGSGATSGVVALNEPVGAMTWFPNNNTPRDKATFSTTVTVPYSAAAGSQNRTVVGNGVLSETSRSSTTQSFTWDQPRQQATYLSFVGIGPYVAAESDVPLTDGTTHEYSYRDSALSAATSGFTAARGRLGEILTAIEGHYGTYPGSSTGVVVDRVPSGVSYALETQDRPFFPSQIDEPTLVHELAHQWFGDSVSPADWGDVWLNEGPATFVETEVGAELDGGKGTQDTYYDTWRSSSTASLWSVPAAGFDDPSELFGEQVYTRGAVALEALRSALGDDVFEDVMTTWLRTYGGRSATTAQFIAVAEQVSGQDLDAFFQTWVYGTRKPAAWPVAYDLTLTSDPVNGSDVAPGSTVAYTLTAHNTGKVPTTASTVEVDATELRARGYLDPLPSGLTRAWETITWDVPAIPVGETASVTFTAALVRGRGGAFTVRARGTTPGADCGTGCVTTLRLPIAAIDNPDPVIEGRSRVGDRLLVSVQDWDQEPSYDWEWLRDGVRIPYAIYSSYEATAADLGAAITVRVTGSGEGYETVTRTGGPVTVEPGVQHSTSAPTVTGEPRVGTTLTAVHESWDRDATLTYQWSLDGEPIPGATAATYRPIPAQAGHQLTASVTGTLPGYTTATESSEPVTVIPIDAPFSPVPTLSAAPRVAVPVSVVPGEWTDDAELTYQWFVAGYAVGTGPTYTPRPEDRGFGLTVRVTGTRDVAGYETVTRTSEPVGVDPGILDPAPIPTVQGTATTGQTLTGVRGTWAPEVMFTFNWVVGGVGVPGPSSTTYVVRPQDVGKSIVFAVTGERPGYSWEIRRSRPVLAKPADQTRQPRPSIAGNPVAGRTLRAYVGAHDPGTRVRVQWYVGGVAVPGATATTYRLRAADRGRSVRVRTRTSKLGYRVVVKDSPSLRVR
ncbi:M1 family aminopeptidase [Nocardioides plantarum]|uniref:Aminopeptidase N n=1 Tax=Nocardioides plantarum TaxID=29299 RepID=A0ABV5KGB6_9ACTN|nr:M1 family aminopeptidase [Nocardioides plantarum]